MDTERATHPQANRTGAPNAGGPVGQGDYVVQPGDCMESIAYQHGILAQTLWNLPDNAELEMHRALNVLLPGDRVTIPAIRLREEDRPTDQRHRFPLPASAAPVHFNRASPSKLSNPGSGDRAPRYSY